MQSIPRPVELRTIAEQIYQNITKIKQNKPNPSLTQGILRAELFFLCFKRYDNKYLDENSLKRIHQYLIEIQRDFYDKNKVHQSVEGNFLQNNIIKKTENLIEYAKHNVQDLYLDFFSATLTKKAEFKIQETILKEFEIRENTLNKNFTEIQESLNITKKEIEKVLLDTRKTIATAGVTTYSCFFRDEAKKDKLASLLWLFNASICFIGVVCWLLYNTLNDDFLHLDTDISLTVLLIKMSPRILLVGTMLSGAVWCSKMFKASRQLYVINRHKANALKTFEQFYATSEDPTIKDAVLVEATRTIFSTPQAGYITPIEKDDESIFKVLDVIKSAVASK